MSNKRYDAIDGLRTIAAIGIVMMHVRANGEYAISGFIYDTVISSFTNFVFLFMTVSAFGMCYGYYNKILNNKISISDFYKKRFHKIFPFFATLVLLDILISPSLEAVYEGFADLTLTFGLLPDAGNISVIGVGWFLGLIFVFYLCFPFFCVLMENKTRAWIVLGISLVYNYVCSKYFEVSRSNILYSACFFTAGGLVYLYREIIENLNRCLVLSIVTIVIIIHYVIGGNTVTWILVSTSLLIYALCTQKGILENRITKFLSGVSMEIYLSHMVVFRIIEKLKMNTLLGNGWVQYITTTFLVIIGSIVFAVIMQRFIRIMQNRGIRMGV